MYMNIKRRRKVMNNVATARGYYIKWMIIFSTYYFNNMLLFAINIFKKQKHPTILVIAI